VCYDREDNSLSHLIPDYADFDGSDRRCWSPWTLLRRIWLSLSTEKHSIPLKLLTDAIDVINFC